MRTGRGALSSVSQKAWMRPLSLKSSIGVSVATKRAESGTARSRRAVSCARSHS